MAIPAVSTDSLALVVGGLGDTACRATAGAAGAVLTWPAGYFKAGPVTNIAKLGAAASNVLLDSRPGTDLGWGIAATVAGVASVLTTGKVGGAGASYTGGRSLANIACGS